MSWSAEQGITANGIDYRKIPNSGLGIVAHRHIKAGEELINVPLSALVTVNTVPKAFREQHKQITVQGLLASFLASTDIIDTAYAPWASTWPTLADFRKALPLFWPQDGMAVLTAELLEESSVHGKLGVPLTPAIEHPAFRGSAGMSCSTGTVGLLQEQRKKISADWKITTESLPKTSFEHFVYYWCIVNTRTFYFETPNVKTHPPRDDCIVMCPFIDLFNHNDSGVSSPPLRCNDVLTDQCNVQYGPSGYTVTSDKAYGDKTESVLFDSADVWTTRCW
ncbi:MAG: hypothetical protein Q9223_007469 [Gallowayella weberi]